MDKQTQQQLANLVKSLKAKGLSHLTLNSRDICPGSGFVALGGQLHHGMDYCQDAIDRGAAIVLTDIPPTWEMPVPHIVVPALGEQLSYLANLFYDNPFAHCTVTAITGTNGKTSISFWLQYLLTRLGEKTATMGTLGVGFPNDLLSTGLTTPDAITIMATASALKTKGMTHLVMEASSHGLDQYRLAAVPVKTAIFTNLTPDHGDYHDSFAAYGEAKAKLFTEFPITRAIINRDDDFGQMLWQRLPSTLDKISFGKNGDVYAVNNHQGLTIYSPWGEVAVMGQDLAPFMIANLLAVLAQLLAEGVSPALLSSLLAKLPMVPGRMQRVLGSDKQVFIDYAHTPDALEQVLKAAKATCKGKLVLIFGCGGNRDKAKRGQMGQVADRWADDIILTSDNPRDEDPESIIADIRKTIQKSVRVILDRRIAIETSVRALAPEDCLIIAGKGHENFQILKNEVVPMNDYAIVSALFHQP